MGAAGVLVLGECAGASLRSGTSELIATARALAPDGGAPVLALIGAGAAEEAAGCAEEAARAGVAEIDAVEAPVAYFEAHVWQAALEGLIESRRPSLVLAAHTPEVLSFLPAVAARGRHGLAADAVRAELVQGQVRAWRPAYGERLLAELDFPGHETVLLTMRAAAGPAEHGQAQARANAPASKEPAQVRRVELDLGGRARSERVELRPPAGEPDLERAELLVAIGRGAGRAENVPALERLAERLGGTLAASGPPVEAGWVSRTRKVGQSGSSVAPRVYLALGISGAPQHLAGIARARTVIAVNTDPEARIFDVADHGAVADLFEVAAELERQLG